MAQVAGRKSLKNMVTSPYEHWKPLTDSQFYGAMGDFVQFCKESIILDKNGRPVPMHLNEAQVLFSSEVLKAMEPIMKKIPTKSVNVLCHKSRQMGITTVTLKLEQFVASKSTNFNILHVMPTDSEANEMIDRKFLPILRGTHPELLADIVPVANYADFKSFSGIELDNRITFMSAGVKGAGHGRTIHMLVEDEHCFGDDVEIMTDKGLISIADVTEDTLVAQWDDGKVSFVKPTYLHRYDNPSDVYELTTHNGQKNIVTGKHEFVLKSRTTGNYVKKKLTDINFNNLWHIPMSGEGSTERKLSYLDRLVIAAQADGHVSRINSDRKNNMHVRFCLKLERKIARLKFLIDSAGLSYKECESGGFAYIDIYFPEHIDVKNLSSYFSFDANPDTAKSILDEMVFWDGHKEKDGRLYYSSKNKTNVEFFAYMGFQSGYTSWIGYQDPVWRCRLKPGESRSIQNFKKEKIKYDKPVYCVTVPSGNIVVKLGTGLYVTGNSKYSDPFNLEAGILPAMSGNTVRIVLFTAKGMNHSFDLSKVAQDPESDWVYIFLPWYILSEYEMEPEGRYKSLNSLTEYDLFLCSEFKRAGISPSRWARKLQWYNYTFINEAKKDQLYMFENYPTVAAESFQASGAPIFDSRLLYDWMEREFKTIDAFYADGETRFDYVDGGAIKEYEAPIKNHQYIIGLDPAEGEVKGDDSALVVWDITKPKIKAVAAYNGIISQNDFAELAYDMAMRYNMALLVPERNMGSLMIKWLTEVKGYLNIWTDANKVTGYNNLGVRTTVSSKNEMIARLKFLMNNGYYEDFDPVFCEQGLYFTFQKTASGQLRAAGDSGHHDDAVLARMLCTMAINMDRYKGYTKTIQKEGRKYGR